MRHQHALLLALLLCHAIGAARGTPEADFSVYHTKDAIFQLVGDTVGTQQQPAAMAITTEAASDGNYTSELTVVTVEPGGLTGRDERKIRMLLDFGQHGRELITNEVALKLLQLLAHDAQLVKFCAAQGIPSARLLASLKHVVMKIIPMDNVRERAQLGAPALQACIIPMENVRGREKVDAGATCLRKNGRGVDTNRNWGVHWGFKEKDYDPEEEHPGTQPFSEPEAEMLRALAAGFHPHVWVNVHSGMEALFMPYDHRDEVPQGEGPAAALAILQELNRTSCGGRCAVGSGGKSVGYLAHGTATDYMWEELHVPMPFTWEIYGDEKAGYSECFRMFNPSGAEGVAEVVEAWTAAVLRLVLLLPTHPDVARDVPAMVDAGQQLSGAEAAQAANETLAAAEAASSSEELPGLGGVRQGAVATAALPQLRAGGGGVGALHAWRTALLWGSFAAVVLVVCLLQRRAVWRKLSPRGRVFVRRRTAKSPV